MLSIEEVPNLRGYVVESAAPNNFYLSRGNIIFHSHDLVPPFTRVAAIGAPFWKRSVCSFRLAQRLLRFMVTNVLALPNADLFVTFDKTVGVVRKGIWRPLQGLRRPCRVLRSGCTMDQHGDIYFGEYLLNTERHSIDIYKYSPGSDSVETVHTFAAGAVAHVHGIYFDPVSEALYCLTGDDAPECRILKTTDGFASLDTVGHGDESWRAVSIQFSDTHSFYGTDASFRVNHFYRNSRETKVREAVGEADGPVLYSTRLGDDFLFSTSAEGAPSQAEDVASLWRVTANGRCEKLTAYKKDFWHRTLFKLGAIHFPSQSTVTDDTYFHLVGVVGDNRTFRLRR